jgi:uncharacterized membrane protein YeaQ/YmgE (transglycosylase-associated protein family)
LEPGRHLPVKPSMHLLWWAILGLCAGILAKALMPGSDREPKGCLMTSLLGIAGSVLVGWSMEFFFNSRGMGGFIPTLVGATIGAMLLIALMRKFWK